MDMHIGIETGVKDSFMNHALDWALGVITWEQLNQHFKFDIDKEKKKKNNNWA